MMLCARTDTIQPFSWSFTAVLLKITNVDVPRCDTFTNTIPICFIHPFTILIKMFTLCVRVQEARGCHFGRICAMWPGALPCHTSVSPSSDCLRPSKHPTTDSSWDAVFVVAVGSHFWTTARFAMSAFSHNAADIAVNNRKQHPR